MTFLAYIFKHHYSFLLKKVCDFQFQVVKVSEPDLFSPELHFDASPFPAEIKGLVLQLKSILEETLTKNSTTNLRRVLEEIEKHQIPLELDSVCLLLRSDISRN